MHKKYTHKNIYTASSETFFANFYDDFALSYCFIILYVETVKVNYLLQITLTDSYNPICYNNLQRKKNVTGNFTLLLHFFW